jgi:hypothetical protein
MRSPCSIAICLCLFTRTAAPPPLQQIALPDKELLRQCMINSLPLKIHLASGVGYGSHNGRKSQTQLRSLAAQPILRVLRPFSQPTASLRTSWLCEVLQHFSSMIWKSSDRLESNSSPIMWHPLWGKFVGIDDDDERVSLICAASGFSSGPLRSHQHKKNRADLWQAEADHRDLNYRFTRNASEIARSASGAMSL